MKQLPEAEIYEQGLHYWPYKISQQFVLDQINKLAPREARLIDLMCGPGNLLGRINKIRPDLILSGTDIDPRYITYGRRTYHKIEFIEADILQTYTFNRFNFAVCTGAIHHLPYKKQEQAIYNIGRLVYPGSQIIIADCYIDDYKNERERRLAAAKLGYEYLQATIKNGAPKKVLAWTADILHNDVLGQEFKTSLEKRLPILKRHFREVRTIKNWPNKKLGGYGDYTHICTT